MLTCRKADSHHYKFNELLFRVLIFVLVKRHRGGAPLDDKYPTEKGGLKRTKKVRLILISSLITSIVLSSYFAVGLISAKPAGDPRSYVVDICGPPPTQGGFGGGSTSSLLACPTGQGSIAWGTDCTLPTCQFGPGTSTSVISLAISFTWQNCCSFDTVMSFVAAVSSSYLQHGSVLGRDFFTFTLYITGPTLGSQVFIYNGASAPIFLGSSGIALSFVANGGNVLSYSHGQGIVGIRAVVTV